MTSKTKQAMLAAATGCLVTAATFLSAAIAPPAWAQQQGKPAIGNQQDAILIAGLVRSHLIALHHANVTGNYAVLRDLGAPSFRERNTAADLAASFAAIRKRNIDLQAAAVLQPEIVGTPVIDANNLLRVSGTFPTEPVAIRFDLAFQVVDRVWRLIGITVAPISSTDSPSAQSDKNSPREVPAPPARPKRQGSKPSVPALAQ